MADDNNNPRFDAEWPRVRRKLTFRQPDVVHSLADPVSDSDKPDLKSIFREEFAAMKDQIAKEHFDDLVAKAQIEAEARCQLELEQNKKLLAEAELKAVQQRELLKKAAQAVNEFQASLQKELSAAAAKLAMECVYNIVGKNELYAQVISDAISAATGRVESPERIDVYLCESDYNMLAGFVSTDPRISLNISHTLYAGEVHIRSGFSVYIAGLTQQLDEARNRLLKQLENVNEH